MEHQVSLVITNFYASNGTPEKYKQLGPLWSVEIPWFLVLSHQLNFLASLDDWWHLDQRTWHYDFHENSSVQGTGSLISSDPPCKNGNARFTTVPFKNLSDQVWNRYSCFVSSSYLFLFDVSPRKWPSHSWFSNSLK